MIPKLSRLGSLKSAFSLVNYRKNQIRPICSSSTSDEKLHENRKRLKQKLENREWIRLSDIPVEDRQKYQKNLLVLRIIELTTSFARIGAFGIFGYWLYKRFLANESEPKLSSSTGFETVKTESGYIVPSTNIRDGRIELFKQKLKPGDTVIVGIPRSGMSIIREIVWLLRNDSDFKMAETISADVRVPCLHKTIAGDASAHVFEDKIADFGIYTSLIPLDADGNSTPSDIKIICCIRNPFNASISGYNLLKKTKKHDQIVPLNEFIAKTVYEGESLYGPWWLSLNKMSGGEVLVVSFEDVQKDLKANIRKIADFLKLTISDDQIDRIACFLSKSKQRSAKTFDWIGLTPFLRKGEQIYGPTVTNDGFAGDYNYKYDLKSFRDFIGDKLANVKDGDSFGKSGLSV